MMLATTRRRWRFSTGWTACLLPLLTAVLLESGWAADVPPQPPAVLTNVAAVRNLTTAQAQLGPAVEVTGVVTWIDASPQGCFLDDGATAVWVDGLRPGGTKPGSRLRVRGAAHPGFYTPAIQLTKAVILGTNALPAPRSVLGREQLAGKWDGIRLTVSGTLIQTRSSDGKPEFRLLTDGVAIGLQGADTEPPFPPSPRRVTVTGISSLGVVKRQLVDCSLLIDSWDAVRIEPGDLPEPGLVPIGGLLAGTNAAWLDRPVRLSGIVTWPGPDGFFLADESGGIMVRTTNSPPVAFQTKADVVGIVRRTHSRLEFAAMTITSAGIGRLPPPIQLQESDGLQIPSLNGRRVTLRGRFVHHQGSAAGEEWVLARPEQSESVRVILPLERPSGRLDGIRFDSTLAVTGILRQDSNQPGRIADTYLLVATEADVRLVNPPPLSRGWSVALILTTVFTVACSMVGAAWWWHATRISRLRQVQLETENQLKNRFALIAETASDQIITLSHDGRITSINPAGHRLLAQPDVSVIGREYADWIGSDWRAIWRTALAEAPAATEVPPFELRLVRSDGTSADVEVLLRRLNDTELQCIGRDLTERRRVAELADQNELWQRLHIEQTPLGVVQFDSTGIIRAWNPAAERIFGWHASEIIGQSWETLVPAAQRDVFQRIHVSPTVLRSVNLNLTRPGALIECEWFNNPLLDRSGGFIGVTALVSDVTANRRVQRELGYREQQLRAIVDSMAEGMIVIDRERRILSTNQAAERILALQRDGLIGQILPVDWKCLRPDGSPLPPEEYPIILTLRTGAPVDAVEFSFIAGDGVRRWVSVNSRVLSRNARGETEHVIATFADVTARRAAEQQGQRLEEQLRHSEKLRALGTLAGGVAHDFNNLLASILGNAELIQLDLPADHPAAENAKEISAVAQRGADLVRRILSFSRPQPASRARLQLSSVVDDSLRMISKALPPGVRLHFLAEAGEPAVCGDPTQLNQVVMNLCTNAAHAMEEKGGDLEVKVEGIHLSAEYAAAHPPLQPGPAVRLRVRDTGSGMDPATLARVFEPFFTTKGPGRGTGLGLAIVHNIVQVHRGWIFIESAVGQGTTIDVVLPVDTGVSVPRPTGNSVGELPPGAGEELLVVDDDASVLRFVERALVGLGYRVTAVPSPLVALARLQREPKRFRLLLTDLSMPEQSGVDLALAVRALLPELPIIIATGYGQTAFEQLARVGDQFPILNKPFRLPELAARLRAELGNAPFAEGI